MDNTPTTDVHLSRALQKRLDVLGSYVELEHAISAANGVDRKTQRADGGFPPPVIERRRLKRIIEALPSLRLSLLEIRFLSLYLTGFGDGLHTNYFFGRPSVLQSMAKTGDVTVFLGSKAPTKAHSLRYTNSHWDVAAYSELQRKLFQSAGSVRVDLRGVNLPETTEEAKRAVSQEGWQHIKGLVGVGRSVISLGSSRAQPVSERILAALFGTEPFQAEASTPPPFRFLWPPELDHVFPSAFNVPAEEQATFSPKVRQAVAEGACGLVFGDRVLLDTLWRDGEGPTYGILAAQRRGGRIWACAAGLTGPATLGAARLLGSSVLDLDAGPDADHSPVWWVPVLTEAQNQADPFEGTRPEIVAHHPLGGPFCWGGAGERQVDLVPYPPPVPTQGSIPLRGE